MILTTVLMTAAMLGPGPALWGQKKERLLLNGTYETLAHHWQLRQWKDEEVVCNLYMGETGVPLEEEIEYTCGEEVLQQWLETPICDAALYGFSTKGCSGTYIHYVGLKNHEVNQWDELPQPTTLLELVNCVQGEWCSQPPVVRVSASEPLESYTIDQILVEVGDQDVVCDSDTCEFTLPLTNSTGIRIRYLAHSTYGDFSNEETLFLRNLPSAGDNDSYRVEIMGDKWGNSDSACALIWGAFPDENTYSYLTQPDSSVELFSDRSYALLAGKLIWNGNVAASDCPDSGLTPSRAANTCGQEKAYSQVINQQNLYNESIYQAALNHQIPAPLLKGVIAQETQFWPYWNTSNEYGLGRLTEDGVSMMLTWNLDYFFPLCKETFNANACMGGFTGLSPKDQNTLKGIALAKVATNEEFDLIAATMVGACQQTGQIIRNATGASPGEVSSYEDLWSLTLADYHAGAGCVYDAVRAVWEAGLPVTWENVAANMEEGGCAGAELYVNRVTTWGAPLE